MGKKKREKVKEEKRLIFILKHCRGERQRERETERERERKYREHLKEIRFDQILKKKLTLSFHGGSTFSMEKDRNEGIEEIPEIS